VGGLYEEDETVPAPWRPRLDPASPADTETMAAAPRPPAPPTPRRPRRSFPTAAAGLIVAVAVLLGVAIGHDVWSPSSPSTQVAENGVGSGQSQFPAITPGGSGAGGSGAGGYSGSAGSGSSPFGSGSSGGGSSSSSGGSGSSSAGSGSSSGAAANPGSGAPANAESIAAKVDPALVDVNSTFSYQNAKGAGTGIVLTSNGEILTNNHVVDGASSISVTDVGNGKTYSGTVVGYDSEKDIAVIQLADASGLQTAKLGDSSTAAAGDPVVAIGNAGGTGGTPSTAAGSITATNQSITAGDEIDGSSEQLSGLIETNADVQAGDSGGSLVNSSGEVIGVDTAASEGFSFRSAAAASEGFAIPINQALTLASQIESGQGSSTVHIGPTAFLGVLVSASNEQQTSQGGGSFNGGSYSYSYSYGSGGTGGSTTSGAQIDGVTSGDAAEKAGLVQGDTITSLNGQTVDSPATLTKLIVGLKPGQSVQLGWVDSSGQSHTTTVVLGTGPPA
jgi:S1-C subfamily serine protease